MMKVVLRSLEESDVSFILKIENDRENWSVSGTSEDFSHEDIIHFVNENQTIETHGQQRFMILSGGERAGLIDLFGFDSHQQLAGVGVVVDRDFRNCGVGKAALNALIEWSRDKNLLMLMAEVHLDNASSIRLFESSGFKREDVDSGVGFTLDLSGD